MLLNTFGIQENLTISAHVYRIFYAMHYNYCIVSNLRLFLARARLFQNLFYKLGKCPKALKIVFIKQKRLYIA